METLGTLNALRTLNCLTLDALKALGALGTLEALSSLNCFALETLKALETLDALNALEALGTSDISYIIPGRNPIINPQIASVCIQNSVALLSH